VHEVERLYQGHHGGARKKLEERPERLFYFRLALALGKTVQQLLEECDALELAEWFAFWTIEPFGSDWDQTATVCTTVAGVAGVKNLNKGMFMPSRRQRDQSPDDMKAQIAAIGAYLKKKK